MMLRQKEEQPKKKAEKPNYIFEVSWEVCNRVGGICTVISTKAIELAKKCDNHILLGPDTWRNSERHPEFIEDSSLFPDWKHQLELENTHIRIGYWDIPGKPKVFLIDFSEYISEKDNIFTEFWEDYRLYSIAGKWDFIEQKLFGYASAKIIENFVNFHLSVHDKIISHFHEWMTGTGILYLRKRMPHIATVFTTHATAVGRCIADDGYPLYENLSMYDGDTMAGKLNIVSAQSLEKLSAHNADVFTTVSEITSQECGQFLDRNVDIVTPNGFENNFVPAENEYKEKRKTARRKIIEVAQALMDYEYEKEPVIVATSGRYEFSNKGYDLFINALAELNRNPNLKEDVIALMIVSANSYGPVNQLYNILNNVEGDTNIVNNFLTHNIHDIESDPIVKMIWEKQLFNRSEDKVRIIFVPTFLDGDDGIFNMKYYDFLTGLDLTAFVSYYEPWGYAPLESVAFGIPTITTSLSGFGKWMQGVLDENNKGVKVVNRTDDNTDEVIIEMLEYFNFYLNLSKEERLNLSKSAFLASTNALWSTLIEEYDKAYALALEKVGNRQDVIRETKKSKVTTHETN